MFWSVLVPQITKEQIQQYMQELAIFAESFNMHGPGAVGDNLEKGTHTFTGPDPEHLEMMGLNVIKEANKYNHMKMKHFV